jgi:hypothetical protein
MFKLLIIAVIVLGIVAVLAGIAIAINVICYVFKAIGSCFTAEKKTD